MNQIPTLTTARLILRPLRLEDAEQAQPLFSQWEVVQHLDARIPWPFPSDGAFTFYRDVALPAMARGEAWHWTLRLQEDQERLIGAIGLEKTGDRNRGFWLARQFRGRGLMLEAADAVTEFWFRELKMPVLRIAKSTANEASRRISLKQGMRVIKTFESNYVSGPHESELWEITAEEWLARHR